jgi:redox-sensitive bicupin YhaK (pirin superfamily)
MKTNLYKASERGYANYDWLQANYSFSFANYYNPGKENFGALRVLNDDVIQGGTGFGEHPHQNMEIITIPLQGSLKHKDSMSNTWIPLHTGEVQVMSAGSGVYHSEKNNSSTDFLNLFQLWIIPDKMNIEPSYDQKNFEKEDRKNNLQRLVSSHIDTEDQTSLKINQDARISRIDLDAGKSFSYRIKSRNHGVYVMLISGQLSVEDQELNQRDALGIWDTDGFELRAEGASEVLFIEVPMNF